MNDNQELIKWLEASLAEAEEQFEFYAKQVQRLKDALHGAKDPSSPEAKEQEYFLHGIERDYLS